MAGVNEQVAFRNVDEISRGQNLVNELFSSARVNENTHTIPFDEFSSY